jgi:hypothetical protein
VVHSAAGMSSGGGSASSMASVCAIHGVSSNGVNPTLNDYNLFTRKVIAMNSRYAKYIASGVLVFALAFAVNNFIGRDKNRGDSNFLMAGRAKDMQSLIADYSQLAVIGTFTSINQKGFYTQYDNNGAFVKVERPSVNAPGALPFTDYTFTIQRLVKGKSLVEENQSITIRLIGIYGDRNNTLEESPLPNLGDRELIFLAKNPDGTYGSRLGAWGRFIIDKDIISSVNKDTRIFESQGENEQVKTSAFLSEMQKVVDETSTK